MNRREFLYTAGLASLAAALPGRTLASLTGLSDDQIERRIKDLLAQMTLEEKIEQMHGRASFVRTIAETFSPTTWDTRDNERLGIPGFRCIDGPRGVGMGRATCFPVSMARGAAWDPDLELRIGEAMGYEARALGANVLLSGCINLLWHPSWGRAQETYGEDPLLLGRMGAAHITGVQKHVIGNIKHFAVNNIEGNRFSVDARVDERTLREVFLPHFKMCVEAGAASVMSAYNDLNGYLCAHNRHLLRDILKGEWGFDGFVVSDWVMAVEDTVAAANAGLDLEMPSGKHLGRKLKRAVQQGLVSEQVIDEAVTRILRQKLRFLTTDFSAGYDKAKIGGKEHAALALEAAQKGIVLLKNENRALPLGRGEIKRLAVIGELADFANIGDNGSSDVDPPYVVTPLQGIKDYAGASLEVSYDSGKSLSSAKKLAASADAVVIVAGMTFKDEGEGGFGMGDRLDLNLHAPDEALINALAEVNKRCIVVLEAGAAITMEAWRDKVPAILMAWYPGMEGGNALAQILFGEVNPSGKLPHVFPKSREQLYKFDNRAKVVNYDYYHGYRYFEKNGLAPAFPFGFGLSYTSYKYGNLRLSDKQIGRGDTLHVMVDVTNVGQVSGEEIVQVYIGYKGSKTDRPLKDLKGFGRLALAPGETKTFCAQIKAEDLAYYNTARSAWEVEEIEYVVYAGPSSRSEDLLCDSFTIR